MFVLGLVLSLTIGVSLGLLGGGGSILTVPVIHYVFGVETHAAIAMSLLVVGTTSAFAVIPHARAGRVQWRIGAVFGGSSMVGAFVGGRAGSALPGTVLIPAFAAVMIAAGVAMLLRARRPSTLEPAAAPKLGRILVIGLGVGLLTGTLGAGGGFVIVPALTLVGGLVIAEAVGTSLFVIAINSFAGYAGAHHAAVDTTVVVAVTAVAIAGSVVGARLVRRISPNRLQQVFAYFVMVIAIAMVLRELV